MFQKHWLALALFLLTLVCFGHVCLCEFVGWDDPSFVTQNPHVLGGLTGANIRWAFSSSTYGGWVPLTWLSYQLDVTVFGPEAAWGFHLTNLLIHAVSVVVFFYLLERMTGELWPSAACAALFAIHPLRVESVAWIAERRDVLSMLLLMVTLAAYRYYTESPGWGRYILVTLCFGMGLAAKQSLVTLPFALLLLDYWPLHRMRLGQTSPVTASATPPVSWQLLILEKVPLLAMGLAVSLITFQHVRQIGEIREIIWQDRLAVSLVAYLGYLEKTFWPAKLAALYPYRVPPWWLAMLAAGLLLAITAVLTYLGRSKPMLLVGWLWFAGTLFPVSGVVPIGAHAMADRYTYMPHLGLFITVVWGIGGLAVWQKARGAIRAALVSLVLAALGMLTWVQVWCWQDTLTLFQHTVSVTENNHVMHAALGRHLEDHGRFEDAEYHILRALEISPYNHRAYPSYCSLLVRQGKYQEAIVKLEAGLLAEPHSADMHYILGVALDSLGRHNEARRHLKQSIEYWESQPPVTFDFFARAVTRRKVLPYLWLGEMALREGHPDQALEYLERAFAIKPDLVAGYQFKGIALARLGRWPEAEAILQSALKLDPQDAATRSYLAFVYARQDKKDSAAREYAELLDRFPDWTRLSNEFALKRLTKASILDHRMAEEIALQLCEATQYQDPSSLDTLAAALAAKGDFAGARQKVGEAIRLVSDPALKQQMEARLHLYENNQPLFVPEKQQPE